MAKKITRRKFIKNSIVSLFILACIGLVSRFYAKYIEPYWIDITYHTISHKLIPSGFSGTKIVQFSDTHLGYQFQIGDLKKCVHTINQLKPDIVLFTGDLLDRPNEYPLTTEISNTLKQIKAPMGKYSIFGNHDHGGNGTSNYEKIMHDSDFHLLKNQNVMISNSINQSIYLAGIDEPMLGTPSWEETMHNIPENAFSILLSHAPDFAERTKELPIALQLSGHSHGGQIQLPIIGAFVTPPFAKHYYDGLYRLMLLTLYVNRGLGTTRLPYRLCSRPEISVFHLQ